MDPSVAAITLGGRDPSAADAFRGQYRLAALRRAADAEWAKADVLLLPSAPTIYTVEAMRADPIALNSRLGTYTNFFNLLGLSGIAVPAGFTENGLPAGVTVAAPGFADEALVPLASALHHAAGCGVGIDRGFAVPPPASPAPPGDRLALAVVGAHLDGMALNHELRDCGARLVSAARTSADYRLFLLDTVPPKPGLVREPGFEGPGIAIEIWSLPAPAFARFVERIPAPLGIGKILLDDGGSVSGFLCEAAATRHAREITAHGGWRGFVDAEMMPA
jgi:allophanate hydrolase